MAKNGPNMAHVSQTWPQPAQPSKKHAPQLVAKWGQRTPPRGPNLAKKRNRQKNALAAKFPRCWFCWLLGCWVGGPPVAWLLGCWPARCGALPSPIALSITPHADWALGTGAAHNRCRVEAAAVGDTGGTSACASFAVGPGGENLTLQQNLADRARARASALV